MRRFIRSVLPFVLIVAAPACSTTSSTPGNFTYPSAMTLGYLPTSNIRTLFVANTFTATISEINTSTNSVMPVTTPAGTFNALPCNLYPGTIQYMNDYLYVAGFTQSTGLLESFNLLTNQTTSTLNLRGYPVKALLMTRTSMLYVLDMNQNNSYLESFTVSSVITPSTFTMLTFTPATIAASPDDENIFISYQGQSFVSVVDPATLKEVSRLNTDYPATVMQVMNHGADTMLYAAVFTGSGYNIESINTATGSTGYEFTVPGIPYDMAISPQRVLLDDNHFSYLGIVANTNGYLDFVNIDYGCNIPAIPSSHTGVVLTSTIRASGLPSLQAITTNDCTTQSETWSVLYNAANKDYTVEGTVSGLQPSSAMNGAFFDAANDRVSFYINPGTTGLNNNDMFTFNTAAAQQIKTLLGIGLPQGVIIDPLSNQAYVTDVLTNSVYVISLSSQSIITTIK